MPPSGQNIPNHAGQQPGELCLLQVIELSSELQQMYSKPSGRVEAFEKENRVGKLVCL